MEYGKQKIHIVGLDAESSFTVLPAVDPAPDLPLGGCVCLHRSIIGLRPTFECVACEAEWRAIG